MIRVDAMAAGPISLKIFSLAHCVHYEIFERQIRQCAKVLFTPILSNVSVEWQNKTKKAFSLKARA